MIPAGAGWHGSSSTPVILKRLSLAALLGGAACAGDHQPMVSTAVSSEELTVVSNFTVTGAPTSHITDFSSLTFDGWMFDRTNYPLNDSLNRLADSDTHHVAETVGLLVVSN